MDQNWKESLGWGDREIDDLRYVAYSYIKQGIYDTALTFFNALSVLTEPSAYDLQTIGALYLQIGDGQKALESLDRALGLDPTHLPTQLNRAKALLNLGNTEQALDAARSVALNADAELKKEASALILAHQ